MILKVSSEIELRTLAFSDADEIFMTIDRQRTYLGEWLPFVAHTKSVDDVMKFIEHVTNLPEEALDFPFTIRKNNTFVGLIHLKSTDIQNRKTDVGYWLSQDYQGQGIITQSVDKLCAFAFGTLDLNRVELKCGVGNIPSKKIPQRLGFTLEGIERDGELMSDHRFIDLEVYSKLKSDY